MTVATKDTMSEVIDADTLRAWLDERRPVTVLDIRTDEDRGQWAIPGSVHINAYDALRAGHAGPLAGASFPPDRPIVTVCGAGRVSQTAADLLNNDAVFTGDTLFTHGVGRPDLHADPASARERARALFASLARLSALAADVVVLPAHASEPIAFDGRAISASMGHAARWLSEWLVSESAFVERVLSRVPATPPNFARIVELNEAGECPIGDPTDLEAGANRCAVS